jgi:hypothetical protein
MGKSLDRVQQPDGSYKWELVELREAQPEPPVCKPTRKRKPAAEPAGETAPSPFDF